MNKNFARNILLDVMLMAMGPLFFAAENVKSGASKGAPAGKSSAKNEAAPVNGQAAAAETAAPKRPATTINSLSDLQALPKAEKEKLLEIAGKRANVIAGTVGKYVTQDGKGVTDDKNLAKRAMGGTGRLIAQYTTPRPGDAVAVEELTRLMRLAWSVAARAKAVEKQSKRQKALTDEELLTILQEVNAPPSYLRPKASKKLYGRVLSYLREGDDAIKAFQPKTAAPATTETKSS